MAFANFFQLRPCLVGAVFAMLLMTGDAFAHQQCGSNESPERDGCSRFSHNHIEPDTPGSCGEGDVGDTFATAHDLGNSNDWPRLDEPGEFYGSPLASEFECVGDVDVYRFELTQQAGLDVYTGRELTGPEQGYIRISGYDRMGRALPGEDYFERSVHAPGTYYVAVGRGGYSGRRTLLGPYSLKVQTYPDFPELQPLATEMDSRRATLLNLSPWQAWVHLYCQKDRPASDADTVNPCTIRFECNGMEGEPVSWNVTVPPKTIFSY